MLKEKILVLFFLFFSICSWSQCKKQNRIAPDGSMIYFYEAQPFYVTKVRSLRIAVFTDKENYFIALLPTPFPKKEVGKKFKDNLEIKLSNGANYVLKHFDTQYLEDDTVLQVLYLIDKNDLEDFRTYEAEEAKINLKGTDFVSSYAFKQHKNAIKVQLNCFMEEN